MTNDLDLTTQVLIQIREELVGMRAEQVKTNERLDTLRVELKGEIAKTNEKVDLLNDKVETLNDKVETLNDKVETLNEKTDAIGRYAKNISRRQDKAIEDLRERVAKLEARRKN